MNHTLIAGHLGADPEVRFTSGGQKVTTFRVACNSRRGGKEETTWWRVTVWGDQFEKMMPYIKRGSPVMVAGEMSKPELYNDREGKPQISLNLTASNIMFSPFGRGDQKQESSPMQQQQPQQQYQHAEAFAGSPFDQQMTQGHGHDMGGFGDEEIPF